MHWQKNSSSNIPSRTDSNIEPYKVNNDSLETILKVIEECDLTEENSK